MCVDSTSCARLQALDENVGAWPQHLWYVLQVPMNVNWKVMLGIVAERSKALDLSILNLPMGVSPREFEPRRYHFSPLNVCCHCHKWMQMLSHFELSLGERYCFHISYLYSPAIRIFLQKLFSPMYAIWCWALHSHFSNLLSSSASLQWEEIFQIHLEQIVQGRILNLSLNEITLHCHYFYLNIEAWIEESILYSLFQIILTNQSACRSLTFAHECQCYGGNTKYKQAQVQALPIFSTIAFFCDKHFSVAAAGLSCMHVAGQQRRAKPLQREAARDPDA